MTVILETMLETTFDVIDGKRLRLARLGSGPPLVLLHGYPDTLQIWSALAPRLASAHQVIAFDWPGIGGSEGWSGGMTPFDLAHRVIRMLDHWGIERATLVAHDMGGQAALAAAILGASRVERLVVMNSLVLWNESTSWEIDLLRRFRINRFLLRHLPRAVFRRAISTSLDERLPRELGDELWRHFASRVSRETIVRMCAGYEGTLERLAAMYPRITAPVSIIWGGRDRHFPPSHAHRLHAAVASSTLQILDGAPHWMVWSHADAVARAILNPSPRGDARGEGT